MEYKHFSHQHNLNIHKVQAGQQLACSGCDGPCYHSVHACWQCNFFLHDHCANANRYVKHPSHGSHPLTLLPRPTYCSGTFLCNACGLAGNSFTYCCAPCEVDLHVHCAFLPPTVTHKSHQHQINLTYSTSTQNHRGTSPEFCKLCSKVLDSKHWSYTCATCDFGVHTFCATSEVALGLYQDSSDDAPSEPVPPATAANEEVIEVELTEEMIVELYKLRLQMQMEQIQQSMETIGRIS